MAILSECSRANDRPRMTSSAPVTLMAYEALLPSSQGDSLGLKGSQLEFCHKGLWMPPGHVSLEVGE